MTPDDVTPLELLQRAIARSGLSARRFAAEVMGRDERNVRRWLAGHPMPNNVIRWLRLHADQTEVLGGNPS